MRPLFLDQRKINHLDIIILTRWLSGQGISETSSGRLGSPESGKAVSLIFRGQSNQLRFSTMPCVCVWNVGTDDKRLFALYFLGAMMGSY